MGTPTTPSSIKNRAATLNRLRLVFLRIRFRLRKRRYRRYLQSAIVTKYSPEQLRQYTPVQLLAHGKEKSVAWLNLGSRSYSDPFFEQTVFRSWCEQKMPRPLRTSTALMGQLRSAYPGLAPAGFIFHVSRCGSTLLSNILRAVPRYIVISEPNPVDALLAALTGNLAEDEACDLFKSLVNAYGQPRLECQEKLFFKFTSWNVVRLRLLRKAFPEVPWIFIYRDPVEVIVSNLNEPSAGLWCPLFSFRTAADVTNMAREEFWARAVGEYLEAARNEMTSRPLLINYKDLAASVDQVLEFLNLTVSEDERNSMNKCLKIYSKDVNGKKPFVVDSSIKKSAASDLVKKMAEQYTLPAYQSLEELRAKGDVAFQV